MLEIVDTMRICPKCGNIKRHKECPFCHIATIDTDIYYDEWWAMSMREQDEIVQRYIRTIIKDTYDPEVAKQREEWKRKKDSEYYASRSSALNCPYCKSSFVSKVTFFDRLLDTTVWGLASDLIGKTHKCVNCDATW